jgi:hypothetical protein
MPSASGSVTRTTSGRLGQWLHRQRQAARALRPAIRWGLFAVPVSLFLLLLYLSVTPLAAPETIYLGSGRRYSSDDLNRISRILRRQQIAYQVDEQRRITVASDVRDQAETAIAKADIGVRPPGDIRDDQAAGASPWESIYDKELREQNGREKILEAMISSLPGVVGSFVRINRPRPRFGLQPTPRASAFVQLETEGDRQLPFRTVQSIMTILTANEPGLTTDAVTVLDHRGHKYLDAGNPALSAQSYTRAREEQYSQEILEKLDWITGVRVSVQLPEAAPAVERSAPSTAVKEQGSRLQASPSASAEAARPEPPAPIVAVNRPLSAVEPPPAPALRPAAAASPAQSPSEPGRIWVRIPRSYYYHVSILPGHKEPSLEEFQKLAAGIEEKIRTGIGMVVPLSGRGAWKATIDVIPDAVPLSRPTVVPTAAEPRRLAIDWSIAGAVGVTAVALVLGGSWIFAARRPLVRRESAPHRLRFDGGSALVPGPSERVREFVRRNPESALSVLERWTRPGGDGP